MRNPNQSSTPENQGGVLQKISEMAHRSKLATALLVGLGAAATGQSLAGCGTDQNRSDANNAPRITLNGIKGQLDFPFGITANTTHKTMNADSVTASTSIDGAVTDINAATLKLPEAGAVSFIAYPEKDCKNKPGVRPNPVELTANVKPGSNALLTVIFNDEVCATAEKPIENPCIATKENGRVDKNGNGIADTCEYTPPPTAPTGPQGKVEITAQESAIGGGYIPSAGAMFRLDENGALYPRYVTTDAQGKATFNDVACGVVDSLSAFKAGFQSDMKKIEVPCSPENLKLEVYMDTITFLRDFIANALIWGRTSVGIPNGQCVNGAQFLYTTDTNGTESSAPYAGPVSMYSSKPTEVTTNDVTGLICEVTPNAAADVTATTATGTPLTTPTPLRVIGY